LIRDGVLAVLGAVWGGAGDRLRRWGWTL